LPHLFEDAVFLQVHAAEERLLQAVGLVARFDDAAVVCLLTPVLS
jgi:hypothetical protein